MDGYLFDVQELNIEDKFGIGWNSRHRLFSIGKMSWDSESSLTADSHAGDTNVPALDYFTCSNLEGERLSGFIS